MNCAIYPRKSKANDNSQSMEQQIADCQNYIEQHYPDSSIYVYGGDYAITGHSIKDRKDFLRMMEDVRTHRIQLVVIMRYDRIARNMRDFCNLYHDMEDAGCNLVSVSQQIDTSTPYGKNFMYQMAAMAELEWSLTSERYKDMLRYRREHGLVYNGHPPYGYKVIRDSEGLKRLVKDENKDVSIIFDYYKLHKNKMKTVEYIKENHFPDFTYDIFRHMLENEIYIGKVNGNDHYCEPYLTEEEFEYIRNIKIIKHTKHNNHYFFSGLIACPRCDRRLDSMSFRDGATIAYRCGINRHVRIHKDFYINQSVVEKKLLKSLDEILNNKVIHATVESQKKTKADTNKKEALTAKLDRLNYMFEKGRISVEEYESKYAEIEKQIAEIKPSKQPNYSQIRKELPENWKEIYNALDDEHKKLFWHSIISKITISEDRHVLDISFV